MVHSLLENMLGLRVPERIHLDRGVSRGFLDSLLLTESLGPKRTFNQALLEASGFVPCRLWHPIDLRVDPSASAS